MILSDAWLAGIDALGVSLLHFLWQGAALGLLYALLRPLCVTATARYRLGMSFLLGLLLCPILTAIRVWPGAAGGGATVFAGGPLAIVAEQGMLHWQAALPWLVAAWVSGVVLLATRSLWQWHKLQRLLRAAQRPGSDWEARLAQLCTRFGLRRPVRLLCSARAVTPMLIGWIKPAILLPVSLLSGFPPQQVELILAHELAHVRRWDYLANLLQVVIETVLFYHPVVHWIGRDVRDAREECCDDLVLRISSTDSALPYARALAGLEELRLDMASFAPALGADGGVLIARIRRIVGVTEMAQPAPRNYAIPLFLAAAMLIGMLWQSAQQRTADFAAAIERLSSQALALVSGNPRLTVPADFVVFLPAPEIQSRLPVVTVPTETDVAATDGDVRIESPRIAVSVRGAPGRIGDVVSSKRIAMPELPAADMPSDVIAPLQVVAPTYPPRAMEAGIEGQVVLGYRVEADGHVGGIRVLSARPSGVFEQAAVTALNAWRFPPGTAGALRTQNFKFTLNRGVDADKCQSPTGTMICRRPGD
jgi:TonB family protein